MKLGELDHTCESEQRIEPLAAGNEKRKQYRPITRSFQPRPLSLAQPIGRFPAIPRDPRRFSPSEPARAARAEPATTMVTSMPTSTADM